MGSLLALLPASRPVLAQEAPEAPVAVILPLKSNDFRRAADAVLSGIAAARVAVGSKAQIVVHETDGTPESTRQAFAEALASAPRAIIGPLTRSASQGIPMEALTVPTLVLNTVELDTPTANLWTYGLNIESEAQQVASLALSNARMSGSIAPGAAPTAIVLQGAGPLQKRSAQAFTAAFTLGGGVIAATLNVPPNGGAALKRQVAQANPTLVFLALDATQASNLRPWLRDANCWGTGQLNSGQRTVAIDLDGVHFVDLPWLVQRDSANLTAFVRNDASTQFGPDLARLYALGLDAWTLALELARGTAAFDIDGATGRLTASGNRIERRSSVAIFRNGTVEYDGQ
ncbi:hypothetical protein BH10PSE17_BH10PSE17_12880 [soil metagenome]